ncbi:MAG: L-histidine N(alpha)-methyltransferase [Okeania sp. SIO2F4]|nr:L-histidine N(alpha)-methyltransferase [Okeania sp. SIO2F4]
MTIKTGEEFCFGSSYKYPVEVFQNMAKESGFNCLDCFIDKYQRMTIHVLKAGKK